VHKVAQFEYDLSSKKWNLFWFDRSLKRHLYPNGNKYGLDKLLAEVKKDPTVYSGDDLSNVPPEEGTK
jgi:hypothetical protein